MAMTYAKDPSGIYVIRLSGIFTNQERKEMENAGRAAIDQSEKIRVLILAEGFSGWGREGNWGDLTFMLEYDPYIEKIAVVADEQWRDKMLMFLGAGYRKAAVKFFPRVQEDKARAWLH
jgi:hypothetical protein